MSNKPLKPESVAIIAYLTPFGLIAAYFLNRTTKDPFVAFHVKNMFGIIVIHYLGVLTGNFDLNLGSWTLHEVIFIIGILMWILSFIRMLQKRKAGVPILGEKFQQWFKFLD